MVSWTSAKFRGGRVPVPPKITSSMPSARRALAEFAPMTQRRASSRLDLQQPFGPTIPVRPGSIRNSVGSTKDLKPDRRRRRKCNGPGPFALFLQERLDGGVELLQRLRALELLVADQEGRRRLDAVLVDRLLHPVLQGLE